MTDIWQHRRGVAILTFSFPSPAPSSRVLSLVNAPGAPDALSKLLRREGRAGAEGAILPYVGHLQLISTLKIGAACCQLCQYKLTKPNLT